MDWQEILSKIILGLIGIGFTALSTMVTYWISKFIKDEHLKKLLNSLNELARSAVLEVYQTYVEELKGKGLFDKEAQSKALSKAIGIIKANLDSETKKWLEENKGDVEAYLKTLIESQIALLKK